MVTYIYSQSQKSCNTSFSMDFGIQSTQRLVLICGSMNKNQSLDEQAAFQNSLKKKCYNFSVTGCILRYFLDI